MNIRTLTITESNQPLVLRASQQSNSAPTYLSLINELGKILTRYANNTDTLSKTLLQEGEKFKRFVLESKERPPLECLIDRIDGLRALLQNPYTKTLFQDPWLVADKVWEKAHLDLCYQDLPFPTQQPVNATPHALVKEFIGWLNVLPDSVTVREIIAKVHQLESQEMKIKQQSKTIDSLRAANQWLIQEIDERDAQRDLDLVRVEAQATAFVKEARDGLAAVKEEYQKSKKVTIERLDRTEKNLEESKEKLSDAQKEIAGLKSTVSSLAYQNSCLAGRVGWLEGEVNNSSSCSIM
jgi:hypothetical protein